MHPKKKRWWVQVENLAVRSWDQKIILSFAEEIQILTMFRVCDSNWDLSSYKYVSAKHTISGFCDGKVFEAKRDGKVIYRGEKGRKRHDLLKVDPGFLG